MFKISLRSFGAFPILPILTTLYLESNWSWGETKKNVFNVFLRSFDAFSIIDNLVSLKWLVVEKMGTLGHLGLWDISNIYRVPFNLVFKVILGFIQCSGLKTACISKRAGRRVKRTEIWFDTGHLHTR